MDGGSIYTLSFSGTILYDRFLTLFCAKITAVAINDFFLSGKEFRHHRYIVNIRRSGFNGMRKPTVLINSDMRFIAEIPRVPFACLMCVRVAFAFLVFVEVGAAIIVESTIVPFSGSALLL